jgi:carbonic anhydrase
VSVTDEYLENNRRYAETFTGPLPLPPARQAAVVACMDARLDVYRILGLADGESLTFTDDAFKASIQDETGIKPEWAAEAFSDLDVDVRQSIARIKASPFIPHTDSVRGFVFDVATGVLREVS